MLEPRTIRISVSIFPAIPRPSAATLGDLGYYDLRDGAFQLYAQQNASLEGTSNNAKVIPNLKIGSGTIPDAWFVEAKIKVNFDQFDREAYVGLLIGSDADNYCSVQLKHDLANTDYLNVAFEQSAQLAPNAVQDGKFALGVNYGYVTVRVERVPDSSSFLFSVIKADGTKSSLAAVTATSSPALYAFLSNVSAGMRVGIHADSAGHYGVSPAAFQNFDTNLPVETAAAPASNVYKQDFTANDTALSFDVPGATNTNFEVPTDYRIVRSEYDVILNAGMNTVADIARNVVNLKVSDRLPIPENWFVKVRVNTGFDGLPSNPWAGFVVLDDADNWVGLGRKHSAFGGNSIDYATKTTKLAGRTSNDVAQYAYPFIDPNSGGMTLTMQRDPASGKIALTFQGANGDGMQFGYLKEGDTRYAGGPRGQFYSRVYTLLSKMNGKRIGLYGDNDYQPKLMAKFDYIMTNLPVEVTIPVPIAGKLEFQDINPQRAPDQHVTFTFVPTDPNHATITKSVMIAATGEFRFESVPPDNYRVLIKADRYLQGVCMVDTRQTGQTNLAYSLMCGDINGDNIIDSKDLALMVSVFNAQKGDGDYEKVPLADLDQNGWIDVDDLTIMLFNYNYQGDV